MNSAMSVVASIGNVNVMVLETRNRNKITRRSKGNKTKDMTHSKLRDLEDKNKALFFN